MASPRSRKPHRRHRPHCSRASSRWNRSLQARLIHQLRHTPKPQTPASPPASYNPATDPGCLLWAAICATCFVVIALKLISDRLL